MIRRLIILLLIVGCEEILEPEDIKGCIDVEAGNYNSNANIDDGSCNYGNYINLNLGYDWIYSTKKDTSTYNDECGNIFESGVKFYQQYSVDSIHISNQDTIGRLDWDFYTLPLSDLCGRIYDIHSNNYLYLENQSGLYLKHINDENQIDTILNYPLLTNKQWYRGLNGANFITTVVGNDTVIINNKILDTKHIQYEIEYNDINDFNYIKTSVNQWWSQGIGLVKTNTYSIIGGYECFTEYTLVSSGCTGQEIFDCDGICGGNPIIDECGICK